MKKDIYIFNSGVLKRKDNTLMLESEGGKRYIPVNDVDSIHVFGEVDTNKSLLEFAAEKEIVIHFYNYYDYYVGSYYPREHLNSGFVILQQCQTYLNENSRYYLAEKFIEGAFQNILQVLKYYNRRNDNLIEEIEAIKSFQDKLALQEDIPHIMAVEGNARQIYYQCFNKIINDEDFAFLERSKRPPRDKINSLISFGNSILYNLVLSQIYQTQLDPRIGYLHTTNERRFSLNLDVAEIFKPIIVDRAIFSLLNKGIITKKDFQNEFGGILLKEKPRMVFIKEINDKLDTTIQLPNLKHRVSYKRLIKLELFKVQKYITEGTDYTPFCAKW